MSAIVVNLPRLSCSGDEGAFADFLFLRHGRTAHNHALIVQGHLDIPLDAVGREEAQAAAVVLAEHGGFRRIVASDLSRARQTAAAVARVTGISPAFDPDLRERHFGTYQGAPAGPDFWGEKLDGVETIEAFAVRIERAMRHHLAEPGTLLVAHGGVLRVVSALLGAALEQQFLRNSAPLKFMRRRAAWRVLDLANQTSAEGT